MGKYWIPKFKHELVEWLHTHYLGAKSVWKLKSKAELYAIYYRTREYQLSSSESKCGGDK